MLKIPQLSAPLTKSIRTLEGQLITALAAITALSSAIDPSGLSHSGAAVLLTIQGGALTAQRGLLKGIALLKNVGVDPPATPDLSQTTSEIQQAVKDVQAHIADFASLKVSLDDESQGLLTELEARFDTLLQSVKTNVAEVEHPTPATEESKASFVEIPEPEDVPAPAETVVKPQSALTPDAPTATEAAPNPVPVPA